MLKIIAGKYKNRAIPTLKNAKYRPSMGKMREAIFSILSSGEFSDSYLFTSESKVLDLFAGTGSLGFEALSRGAGEVTLIDINAGYLSRAREFADLLGAIAYTNFLNLNILHLAKSSKVFDLVFIDPPYFQNLVPHTIKVLVKGQWLKNGSIVVAELSKTDDIEIIGFEVIKRRIYGNSKLLILKYNADE